MIANTQPEDAAIVEQIKTIEREVLLLRAHHDPEGEKRMLSPDYVLIIGPFKIAGEEQWQAMGWRPENTYKSADITEIDVRVYGKDTAVTTSRVTVHHHSGKKENLLATRVWIKKAAQWQLVTTHASSADLPGTPA